MENYSIVAKTFDSKGRLVKATKVCAGKTFATIKAIVGQLLRACLGRGWTLNQLVKKLYNTVFRTESGARFEIHVIGL